MTEDRIARALEALYVTCDMVECVPVGHPFTDEVADPIWRIEIDGYCVDFEYPEAANNIALAINRRIDAALASLPDDVSEREAAAEITRLRDEVERLSKPRFGEPGYVPPEPILHDFKPHPRYPWFCDECGYGPYERLKHRARSALDG